MLHAQYCSTLKKLGTVTDTPLCIVQPRLFVMHVVMNNNKGLPASNYRTLVM